MDQKKVLNLPGLLRYILITKNTILQKHTIISFKII